MSSLAPFSTGLAIYISLIALFLWKGNEVFGKVPNYLGPVLFLTLFVVSALICATISLAYPFYLAWEKRETKKALSVVFYTAVYLFVFLLIVLALITIF